MSNSAAVSSAYSLPTDKVGHFSTNPKFDLEVVNWLLQYLNPRDFDSNVILAAVHGEIDSELWTTVSQLLLKEFPHRSNQRCTPVLRLNENVSPREVQVLRWLLLSFGGAHLWNHFTGEIAVEFLNEDRHATASVSTLYRCCEQLENFRCMIMADLSFNTLGRPLMENETNHRQRRSRTRSEGKFCNFAARNIHEIHVSPEKFAQAMFSARENLLGIIGQRREDSQNVQDKEGILGTPVHNPHNIGQSSTQPVSMQIASNTLCPFWTETFPILTPSIDGRISKQQTGTHMKDFYPGVQPKQKLVEAAALRSQTQYQASSSRQLSDVRSQGDSAAVQVPHPSQRPTHFSKRVEGKEKGTVVPSEAALSSMQPTNNSNVKERNTSGAVSEMQSSRHPELKAPSENTANEILYPFRANYCLPIKKNKASNEIITVGNGRQENRQVAKDLKYKGDGRGCLKSRSPIQLDGEDASMCSRDQDRPSVPKHHFALSSTVTQPDSSKGKKNNAAAHALIATHLHKPIDEKRTKSLGEVRAKFNEENQEREAEYRKKMEDVRQQLPIFSSETTAKKSENRTKDVTGFKVGSPVLVHEECTTKSDQRCDNAELQVISKPEINLDADLDYEHVDLNDISWARSFASNVDSISNHGDWVLLPGTRSPQSPQSPLQNERRRR